MATKVTPDKLHQMSESSVKEMRRICVEENDTEGVQIIDKYNQAMAELRARIDARNGRR